MKFIQSNIHAGIADASQNGLFAGGCVEMMLVKSSSAFSQFIESSSSFELDVISQVHSPHLTLKKKSQLRRVFLVEFSLKTVAAEPTYQHAHGSLRLLQATHP